MPDGNAQDPMQSLLDRIDAMQEEVNALQRRIAESPTYEEVNTRLADVVPSELVAPAPVVAGEPDTDPVLRLYSGSAGGASYWDSNWDKIPDGDTDGDMLVWRDGAWELLANPNAAGEDDYAVLQLKNSESQKVKWDWVRAHG